MPGLQREWAKAVLSAYIEHRLPACQSTLVCYCHTQSLTPTLTPTPSWNVGVVPKEIVYSCVNPSLSLVPGAPRLFLEHQSYDSPVTHVCIVLSQTALAVLTGSQDLMPYTHLLCINDVFHPLCWLNMSNAQQLCLNSERVRTFVCVPRLLTVNKKISRFLLSHLMPEQKSIWILIWLHYRSVPLRTLTIINYLWPRLSLENLTATHYSKSGGRYHIVIHSLP